MTRMTTVYRDGRPTVASIERTKEGRWMASSEGATAAGDTPEEAADNLTAALTTRIA